jgi:hypothetical protein
VAVSLIHFVADHIAEHPADRRTDKSPFGIPADCLANQRAASCAEEQAIDPVVMRHRLACHRPCQKYCRDCHLHCFHVIPPWLKEYVGGAVFTYHVGQDEKEKQRTSG